MTPREAERQVHRRARALAIVRTKGRAAKPLTVHLACVEDGGRWNATVTVHVGDEQVVHERADGADPTAALLTLPDVLALEIEGTRSLLLEALREGEDKPEDEPALAAASSRPKALAKRTARPSPDDGQVVCKGCGVAPGAPHLPICPHRGER